MDFAVAGIVIGGLLVAIGVFVRDLGPRVLAGLLRRERSDISQPGRDPAWKRYCIAAGSLITAGGLVIVLVTVLAIVFDVSDATGKAMVLAASVVALGCIALAVAVVTPHYRKGGFEPRTAPVDTDQAARIPVPSLPADDLFAIEPLVADLPAYSNTTEAPVADDSKPSSPPEHAQIAAEATENRDAKEPVEPSPTENLVAPTVVKPEAMVAMPVAGAPTAPVNPDAPGIVPVVASQRIYEQNRGVRSEPIPAPPLLPIDDDDLPAWNAPVRQPEPPPEPEPVVKPVISSVPVRPAPPATPGGFQSSLLADLTESPDEPQDISGVFKSRLLNELTRTHAPAPEQTVDVLLDEIPVPPTAQSEHRNSGSDR